MQFLWICPIWWLIYESDHLSLLSSAVSSSSLVSSLCSCSTTLPFTLGFCWNVINHLFTFKRARWRHHARSQVHTERSFAQTRFVPQQLALWIAVVGKQKSICGAQYNMRTVQKSAKACKISQWVLCAVCSFFTVSYRATSLTLLQSKHLHYLGTIAG